jgi:hypothetical protein
MSDPWTLGWETIAAVDTATAAVLSVVAIIIPARAAGAARRAAEAAENQLAAQSMPVVVELPRGGYLPSPEQVRFPDGREIDSIQDGATIVSAPPEGNDPARISVPIQNVGPGLQRSPKRSWTSATMAALTSCSRRSRSRPLAY